MKFTAALKSFVFAVTALAVAGQAHARTFGVDVTSALGAFEPIALGENLDLNPCGSNVVRGNSSQVFNSICSTSEPDRFSINYLISRAGTTSALAFGSAGQGVSESIASIVGNSGGSVQNLGSASDGLGSVSVATGSGTLFSTAGTYVISLITAVQGGVIISQSDGLNQRTYNDNGLEISGSGFSINGATVGNFDGTLIGNLGGGIAATANGLRNVAFAQAALVVEAVTVPEPAGMAVFAMGLAGIAYARRRKVRTGNV